MKYLCAANDTLKRVKSHPQTAREYHISDTGLTSRLRKELLQRIKKKQANSKVGKGLEEASLQRYTNGQEAHRRCATSLDVSEIQIKSTVRYHLTPTRMTII